MNVIVENPHCQPVDGPLDAAAAGWRRGTGVQFAGALLAVLPLVGIAAWMYLVRERAPSLEEMFGGPLLGGGFLIFWVLLIHLWFTGDRITSLGVRTDSLMREVTLGIGLAVLYLAMNAVTTSFLFPLFPRAPTPPGILELLIGVSRSPALLTLWLGPVVWIGVAGFEELWRVHLLRRLWRIWPRPLGRWGVIVAAAALVGGVHLYQPPAIMISIGITSVVSGWFFMRTGRFWALVVAHGLYDSVQIVMAVISIRQMPG